MGGHASCAHRLEIQKDHSLVDKVLSLANGDRSHPVQLYCRSGNRAGQALKILKAKQWTSVTNAGGWKSGQADAIQKLCECTTKTSVGTTTGTTAQMKTPAPTPKPLPPSGLTIWSDDACVKMGAKSDVTICRVGPKAIQVSGDLIVNGKSLSNFMERFESFMDEMDKMDKLDKRKVFTGKITPGKDQVTTKSKTKSE